MKKGILIVLVAFALLVPVAHAESQHKSPNLANFSGSEWLLMSDKQKDLYVLLVFQELQKLGIHISYSPRTYIAKIDEIISHRPDTLGAGLRGIIASTIYRSEPAEIKAEFPN